MEWPHRAHYYSQASSQTTRASHTPVASAPYRAGSKTREYDNAKLDKMLHENIIKPAQTKWSSSIMFAPKKNRTLRFCAEFRNLNAMTNQNSYFIPRTDKCIDSLGDVTVFSTIDANIGHWQTEIDEADCDETTLTFYHGLYQFILMLFRLRNAPSTF